MERSMSEHGTEPQMDRMNQMDEMELEPCFSRLQSVDSKMNVAWSPFVGKTPDRKTPVDQFQMKNRYANLGIGMASLIMSPASEMEDTPLAKSQATSKSELELPVGGRAAGIGERRRRRQLAFGEIRETRELQLDPSITSLASSASSSIVDILPVDAYYAKQQEEEREVEVQESIQFMGVKEHLFPRPTSTDEDDQAVESRYTCYFCEESFSSHEFLEQHIRAKYTGTGIQHGSSSSSNPVNRNPNPRLVHHGNGTISIKVPLPIQKDKYKAGIQRLYQSPESEYRTSLAKSSNIQGSQDEELVSCPMCSVRFCTVREFKVHSVQAHGKALW
eukprot:CAMPEP_0184696194 /NCGR_PEP_ID=MMETSP0313-20130426/3566_1 /TAXON_ID=2792 /ORGANISM="Porphyridium aerugineum, Strain SAG 1380-2" /LENGTH=331 /DNA_ID=CAMNT_0027154771 /DNA_START=437 /DNA_END=1429 /DNA_ORIENTATION=+